MERTELNDLVAFATVARERSFTRAAALIGISPSALSHAMKSLETRLGVRLLARTTRSVAPTEAGQRLLKSLDPAFAEIRQGLDALADWRADPSGTLRITTSAYAAHRVLLPKLPTFLLSHPQIHVEVNIDDNLTDIVTAGYDAGIRLGEAVEKDMTAVRLGPDLRSVIVATPSYFQRYPKPKTPWDLHGHACIAYRLTTSGGLLAWEFEKDGREVKVRPRGPFVVNDGDLAAAAVRAGVGLGYLMDQDAAEDIRSGRLVQVLEDWCPPFPGFYLYHPGRRQSPPALRAFVAAFKV